MSKTVVNWKTKFSLKKPYQDTTHMVTSINIDNFESTVSVCIEKGLEVNVVKFSMEHAKDIGFINFDALKQYCK